MLRWRSWNASNATSRLISRSVSDSGAWRRYASAQRRISSSVSAVADSRQAGSGPDAASWSRSDGSAASAPRRIPCRRSMTIRSAMPRPSRRRRVAPPQHHPPVEAQPRVVRRRGERRATCRCATARRLAPRPRVSPRASDFSSHQWPRIGWNAGVHSDLVGVLEARIAMAAAARRRCTSPRGSAGRATGSSRRSRSG